MTALFTAMLTEPAFADPASVLVKQPVEYLVGLLRALDLQPAALPAAERRRLVADLDALGQVPFRPPSVGGWPTGSAWLTTTAARVRTRLAGRMAALAELSWLEGEARRARPDALAHRLGIEAWTARTRSALDPAAGDPRRLAALGLCAPEYVVNG
jgi:uncharacterized protein (DUF1800 family)